MSEPPNLRCWRLITGEATGRLFTCGRPGRIAFGRSRVKIGDDVVGAWADGLPSENPLHIISLLGRKRDGFSEFAYYSFRSTADTALEQPTFQEWLDERYGYRFVVREFPTTDAEGIPADRLQDIVCYVRALLEAGETVVVVDSAGAERTARVCEALGYERT